LQTERRLSRLHVALLIALVLPGAHRAGAELLEDIQFSRPEPPPAVVSEANRLVFDLPRAEVAPTIDGRLDEPIWRDDRARMGQFRLGLSTTPARHSREAWGAYDARNLYLGVRLQREPGTELRVETLKLDDAAIWEDDEVEVFLDPFSSGTRYLQLILNSRGVLYDAVHENVEVPDARADSPGATVLQRITDESWDSNLARAVHVEDAWWSIEMALPLASIGLEGAPAGHRLGLNITSADWDTEEYTTLSPNNSWHDPLQFGVAVLGEPRMDVTALDLSGVGQGRNLLRLDARQLGGPEGDYTLSLTFRAPGQWLHKSVQFELTGARDAKPGLPFTITAATGAWEAEIEVADPTGALVFATRRTGVLPGPMLVDLRSSAVLSDAPPIELSARLGVGQLTARRISLTAQLTGSDGRVVAEQELGDAGGPEMRAYLPVRGLAPGVYVLELLASEDGEAVARGSDIFRVARSPFEGEAQP